MKEETVDTCKKKKKKTVRRNGMNRCMSLDLVWLILPEASFIRMVKELLYQVQEMKMDLTFSWTVCAGRLTDSCF